MKPLTVFSVEYPTRPAACVSIVCLSALFATVQAEEVRTLPEVVVSASRIAVAAEKIGSAHSVLTAEQLAQSGAVYVADALRRIPGIAVNREGGFGGKTQLRLRGSEGNHTLILIDGVEAASLSDGEFDLTGLLIRNIERIEILRGPQSALWGSNALAGVVNIVTRKGEDGFSAEAFAEGGSNSTINTQAGIYLGDEQARAALSVAHFQTEGSNTSSLGDERDGDKNVNASFKGDIDLNDYLNLEGLFRYTARQGETDPQDFAFPATATAGLVIDGDQQTDTRDLLAKSTATLKLLDGRWLHKLSAALTDIEHDTLTAGAKTAGTESKRDVYSYLTSYRFTTPGLAGAAHTLTGLVERKSESFANTSPFATPAQRLTRNRVMYGYVGEYRLDLWDRLFLSGALRFDDNEAFQDIYTFRATAAYLLKDFGTRLHASIGRGATNPTFFEQFGFTPSTYDGNPSLEPERSTGWDVGIEQTLIEQHLTVDITYFQSRLKDEIVSTFDFTTFRSSVANLAGTSNRRGIEVAVTAYPTDDLDLRGSYTYVDSQDATDTVELRRPRHSGGIDLTYRFLGDRARIGLGVSYNGEMEDLEFVPATPRTRVTLDDYTLISVSGSYDISDNLQWSGRIENAANEDYQEIFSYNSPGIAAYTGLRLMLE